MKTVSFFALSLAVIVIGCWEQEPEKSSSTRDEIVGIAKDLSPNEKVDAKVKELDKEKRGGDRDRGVEMVPKWACFSPDGKRIAVSYGPAEPRKLHYDGPRVRFWDVETRKIINIWGWEPPDKGPDGRKPFPKFKDVDYVAFLPDGKKFLTVESDAFCRIWRADNGKLESEFFAGDRGAMTKDGKRLLTLSATGFRLLELPTGKLLMEGELPERPKEGISISADGKRAIFRMDALAHVYWDLEKNKEIQRLLLSTPRDDPDQIIPVPVLFSQDGKRVLARKLKGKGVDENQALILCDARDLREIQPVCKGVSPKNVVKPDIAFSSDGTKVLLRVTSDPKVSSELVLWDLAKDQRIWGIRHWAEKAAYSPKGDRLLLLSPHLLLDARNGSEIGELQYSSPFRVR